MLIPFWKDILSKAGRKKAIYVFNKTDAEPLVGETLI
jgi:hypothetical protein